MGPRRGLKDGVGGNDAALIERWPGLLYDNTRDDINWGFSASADKCPAGIMEKRGAELVREVKDMTPTWSPNLRTLFRLTDPGGCFPINIATSAPVPAWQTTTVTLLGDAIHTMTPGRGVGAKGQYRAARRRAARPQPERRPSRRDGADRSYPRL